MSLVVVSVPVGYDSWADWTAAQPRDKVCFQTTIMIIVTSAHRQFWACLPNEMEQDYYTYTRWLRFQITLGINTGLSMNKLMDTKLYLNSSSRLGSFGMQSFRSFGNPVRFFHLNSNWRALHSSDAIINSSFPRFSPHLKIGPVICRLNIPAFHSRVGRSSLAIFQISRVRQQGCRHSSWEGKSIAVLGVKRWDFPSCQRRQELGSEVEGHLFFLSNNLGRFKVGERRKRTARQIVNSSWLFSRTPDYSTFTCRRIFQNTPNPHHSFKNVLQSPSRRRDPRHFCRCCSSPRRDW